MPLVALYSSCMRNVHSLRPAQTACRHAHKRFRSLTLSRIWRSATSRRQLRQARQGRVLSVLDSASAGCAIGESELVEPQFADGAGGAIAGHCAGLRSAFHGSLGSYFMPDGAQVVVRGSELVPYTPEVGRDLVVFRARWSPDCVRVAESTPTAQERRRRNHPLGPVDHSVSSELWRGEFRVVSHSKSVGLDESRFLRVWRVLCENASLVFEPFHPWFATEVFVCGYGQFALVSGVAAP